MLRFAFCAWPIHLAWGLPVPSVLVWMMGLHSLCSCVVFHSVFRLHFLYRFLCGWTLSLLPYWLLQVLSLIFALWGVAPAVKYEGYKRAQPFHPGWTLSFTKVSLVYKKLYLFNVYKVGHLNSCIHPWNHHTIKVIETIMSPSKGWFLVHVSGLSKRSLRASQVSPCV